MDTRTDKIVETIFVRQSPVIRSVRSRTPGVRQTGDKLFVCNGTQNAVAVVQFDPGNSCLLGLIPVGWFPSAIVYDASRKQIYVANLKGLSRGTGPFNVSPVLQHAVSGCRAGGQKSWRRSRRRRSRTYAIRCSRWQAARARNQPARPVPERVGEPECCPTRHLHHQGKPHLRSGAGDVKRQRRHQPV